MLQTDVIFGIFLISECFIGFMGNSLLFILYMYTFLTQPHLKKPIDVIFIYLTLFNFLTIMIKLIINITLFFGGRLYFWL
jgi:vomeronasal1 receptor